MPIKTNSISTIKKELKDLPKEVLVEHCIRLAKYKKENKELLHYLLYEASDEENYINEIKLEIEDGFKGINKNTLYFAKKTIRKVLRIVTQHIKYSGKKTTQIELLIHFCYVMKNCNVPFKNSKVLKNLYERQLSNIYKAMGALHEDIKLDYEDDLEKIRL
ncbi:hypothetical protein [Saccharicrinis aurantiacus]|uniref:hypothetical protein n=1 Tax=Saccharicrinis aurantiacus TaxID=1849719 RepID=UPI00248FEA04|nr:hypothetical protein [Saccharicrinis aurantiacus]